MYLRKLLQTIGLFVMLLFSIVATAQNKTITGRVTDATGKAVAGATVAVKGQGKGVATSEDGSYAISAPANATTLTITSVGFGTQEISIAGRTTADVTLQSTAANLNEVVVVAYGTRRRGDLTASVTSISSKDFQKGQISSSEQLLQGKVAGLQITSGGGSAGGGSRIRIRGGASLNASNDPLIVIDGVPVEGNGIAGSSNLLNTINPNDIESVSVLKDASATALYGSRASNGVLIITTKKGAAGKVRFNFNTRASVGEIAKKVQVLTGDQVRAIIQADATATGNNTWKNLLGTQNTDWQDVIYQKAFGTDNNLSASGTYANVPYRISLGYLNQDGILKTDHFNRLSSALNLSPKFFTNHLTANIAAKFSRTGNHFADGGAVGNAINFDPTQPVYAKNNFGGYYEWLQANNKPIDLSNRNPLALLELRENRSNVNRFIGNVQLDYKLHFLPDLHVMLNLGMDRSHGEGHDFQDSTMATVYKTGGYRVPFYQQTQTNTLADVSLTYAKELPTLKSKFDVLVLHSYQDFVTDVYNYPAFSYRAIADPAHPERKDTIATSIPTFPTDKPRYRLESYLGRINMTIANNFLLTGSLRRDASSKFSPETRVGYFPAAAAAIKLRELIFQNVKPVSDLKLRFSWGVTGQQNIGDYYGYLPRYSRSTSTAQYQFGNVFYSFLRPGAYDPGRKWETTTTTNLGLDFGFLGNRITGSVDIYKKETKDLLSVIPVAPGTNFDIQLLKNVGNMENRGVEFAINATVIRKRDFSWDLNFNATVNETKITNLLQYPDPTFKGIDVSGISGGTGNKIGKFAIGQSPYSFFVFKQVYDKSGRPIEGLFEDINRDGQVDDNDRYLYKKPAPDALFGASTQVTYKKLTLSSAAHASLGNYLYNNYISNAGVLNTIKNPLNFIGNASVNYLESGFQNNRYLSDYYIENASFFRLDHISVDYNLGRVTKNLSNVRIGASVQNVLVITKYKGLDPENSSDAGTDNNIYPRPRTYSLSVNLDF